MSRDPATDTFFVTQHHDEEEARAKRDRGFRLLRVPADPGTGSPTIVYKSPGAARPEGNAYRGKVYVAWYDTSCITAIQLNRDSPEAGGQLVGTVQLAEDLCPWNMCAGPDGAIYVSIDKDISTEGSYDGLPAVPGQGSVYRVALTPNGLFAGAPAPFTHGGNLSRPSGLCFNAAGSELYVAHNGGNVVVFGGPLHSDEAVRGQPLRIFAALAHPGHRLSPNPATLPVLAYDLQWYEGKVYMVSHARFDDADNHSRVSEWTEDGEVLRVIPLPPLYQHTNVLILY